MFGWGRGFVKSCLHMKFPGVERGRLSVSRRRKSISEVGVRSVSEVGPPFDYSSSLPLSLHICVCVCVQCPCPEILTSHFRGLCSV